MSNSGHSTSHPSHLWTMRFAVSLSAIIALFGTWGWLTHYGLLPRELAMIAGGALMAGVCLVAQGVCNNMAVEARRARAAGLKWSFRAAALVALGFGAVSAMGLHHGWQIAVAVAPSAGVIAPPDWLMTSLFVFIAFGEPVSFWIVEAVKSGGDRDGRPARIDQDTPSTQPSAGGKKRPRTWSPRVVGDGGARTKAGAVGVVAAAALALGGAGEACVQPSAHDQGGFASAAAQPGDQLARARRLAAAGWSERRMAVELGLSRHAVRRALGRGHAIG